MKKWISLLSIVSLVASLAFVMNGCGKGKDDPDARSTDMTESVTEATGGNDFADDLHGFLEELESERADHSYTEHTTDEHYEEEWNELTLPTAKSTASTTAKQSGGKKQSGTATTQAVRRETTTQFQFTSPVRTTAAAKTDKSDATTKKNEATTAKGTEKTTAETDEETTMEDRIGQSGVINVSDVTVIPRPNVTYLDKYVIEPLTSGSYTMQFEMSEEGMSVPITAYSDKDNVAVKLHMGKTLAEQLDVPGVLSSLGDVSMVTTNKNTNPRVFITFATGYYEIEAGGDEMKDLFQEADISNSMLSQLPYEDMQYCGVKTFDGFVVESYKKAEENALYCFYFDAIGLAKIEIKDLSTNETLETIKIKLSPGVSDKNVFKVTGKKYTETDLEKMFGGIA